MLLHAENEDSVQNGWMPIVFAERTVILLVLS